jgi:hypothetical protein
MSRVGVVLSLAIACKEDPLIAAWHAPYEVQSYEVGTGSCDAALAPAEPDTPYLFFAVALGEPDVISLYWCEEPRNCPIEPWVTAAPAEIDSDHAEGATAGAFTLSDTTCNVFYDSVVADLDGDTVTADVARWFPDEIFTVENPSDCEELARDAIGVECDEVSHVEAIRADGF